MKKRWYPIVVILSCCLSAPLAAAGASVYKWTDAKGNVHFSDRPDDMPAAERIEVQVSPPTRGAPPPAVGDAPADADRSTAPRQADAEAQREVREKNCEIASGTLEHNENIDRMYRAGPDGERIFLTDEEREEVLRRSREDVGKWCD